MNLKIILGGGALGAFFIALALAILWWGWALRSDESYAREVYFDLRRAGWLR